MHRILHYATGLPLESRLRDLLRWVTDPTLYEKLRGTAYGELDPLDPRNEVITDIKLAPVNERGMVEYSMDIFILKPIKFF